jgi:hypothetical protein
MGRKNIVASYALFDDSDLSDALESEVINVQNMDNGGLHLAWSDVTGTSTVTIEARNGSKDSWFELDLGSAVTISGATGDHQLIFLEFPFTDIRVSTSAATTGSLDARITLKQIGG